MLRAQNGWTLLSAITLVLLASACAPVSYVAPRVGININLKSVSDGDSLVYTSEQLETQEDEEGSLSFLPRSLRLKDACLVLSITGTGLPRDFASIDASTSCANQFPGLGKLSSVFELGQSPEVSIDYGERRFDVLAFDKRLFGGACPKDLSVDRSGASLQLLGDQRPLGPLAGDNMPYVVASHRMLVRPGENQVDIELKRLGSEALVVKRYGCRSFKVFPSPPQGKTVDVGLENLFFDFECPVDATHLQVQSATKVTSSKVACSSTTGRAYLELFSVPRDEVVASQYNWYHPEFTISAFQGPNRIQAKKMTVRIHSASLYKNLQSADGDDFKIAVLDPDIQYKLKSLSDSALEIATYFEKSDEASMISAALSSDDLWDGAAPIESASDGSEFKKSYASSADGLYLSFSKSSGEAALQKCSSDDCSSSWSGVKLTRDPASILSGDLIGKASRKRALVLSLEDKQIYTSLLKIEAQPWQQSGYGVAQSQQLATSDQFFPEWAEPKIQFSKAQAFNDARLADVFQTKGQLIAGGSDVDPDSGQRFAVLYRSPDGGAHWYRVYKGDNGTEARDALPIRDSNGRTGFAVLVSDGSFVRVLVQDRSTWGY
jgi:hypothetical protein